MLALSSLKAGCIGLDRLVGEYYQYDFGHFMNFLQVLEVFGTGYEVDINTRTSKVREKESHRLTTVKVMRKI